VVSVLTTGPKVRGFDGFLRVIKNPEHHFPQAHVVDLRHVKEPSGMNRTSNVRKQNLSGHFSPKSPDCGPDGSGSLMRIEQTLVRSVSRSLTTECTLTD
jgi:hypothetical protein